MLVVVTAATAIIEPGQLAALRPALLAAVTYSSNWWQALHYQSYFTQFGPPPPLQHLWSLAIEEQFYLVWPLLLIVLLSRCRSSRIRAGAACLCAALSALATVLIYLPGADPSRVYYGTDTHSSALLIGSAPSTTWPSRPPSQPRPRAPHRLRRPQHRRPQDHRPPEHRPRARPRPPWPRPGSPAPRSPPSATR
jgi:peptidoglycan/LPS O-acetylase OafA/YrhL